MLPVDEVPLLKGEHVEEGAEVAAVVDLVSDEGASLLALGLRDAVRYHPRHRRVRKALGDYRVGLFRSDSSNFWFGFWVSLTYQPLRWRRRCP